MTVPAPAASGSFGHFTITPHRSPADDDFLLMLMLGLGLAFVADLLMFTLMGWVAMVVTSFNVAFLGLAFVVSRSERNAVEHVVVEDGWLRIRRASPRGRQRFHCDLPLRQIVIHRFDDGEYGCQSLEVASGPRRLTIAATLLPEERVSFLAALLDALRRAGCVPRVERRCAPPFGTVPAGE